MTFTSTVAQSSVFCARTFHTKQYNRRHTGSVSRKMRLKMSAASSGITSVQTKPLTLTYLEANGWLWEVNGVRIVVDPILVGNLDFGVPWLFDGAKKKLKNFRLENLEELDCLLITQSLDDHCHKRTLDALSNIYQDLHVVSTPNAKPILETLFKKVTYIEPGETTQLKGRNSSEITIRASVGPVLGPPWQCPENGFIYTSPLAGHQAGDSLVPKHLSLFVYLAPSSPHFGISQISISHLFTLFLGHIAGYFIKAQDPRFTLYYEPHCVYNKSLLEKEYADVVITPVIKQLLPALTLVSGQEDAVELLRLLKARYVVPMNNGELETKGLLSRILYADGTMDSFKALLSKALPHVQILEPSPGSPLDVPIPL